MTSKLSAAEVMERVFGVGARRRQTISHPSNAKQCTVGFGALADNPPEEMVEAGARGLAIEENSMPWDKIHNSRRDIYRDRTRAVLSAALRAAAQQEKGQE